MKPEFITSMKIQVIRSYLNYKVLVLDQGGF